MRECRILTRDADLLATALAVGVMRGCKGNDQIVIAISLATASELEIENGMVSIVNWESVAFLYLHQDRNMLLDL